MPIGVIANCLGIIIGGIAGSFIGPRLTESFKTNLNLVFGACAMTMGISSIFPNEKYACRYSFCYFRNRNRADYSSRKSYTKNGNENGKNHF